MNPNQLKRIRKDLRYTQSELAAIVGLTENSVSLYERGKIKPPKYLIALCFGLWLERVAEVIPTIEACLSATEREIDTVFAIFDHKQEMKSPKTMLTIIQQMDGGR